MNATVESLSEFQHPSPRAAVNIPVNRRMYWLLRSELWESRSIFVAPLIAMGLFLLGVCIGIIHLRAHALSVIDLQPIQQDFAVPAYLMMGVTFLVAVFYSLDALYGERRDRSILFWKSLPVSDVETVLAKAIVPILVVPLVGFVFTVIMQWLMLLLSALLLIGSGLSATALWNDLPIAHMSAMLFFHLVAGHGFWYAPFYGWLLLVSAWARRTPILWAFLPPLVLMAFEKIAFGTAYFAGVLRYRFAGAPIGLGVPGDMSMHSTMTVGQFLATPGLWTGLAFTAACLAGAVWLRRSRGPV